jgi:hypothetical protein
MSFRRIASALLLGIAGLGCVSAANTGSGADCEKFDSNMGATYDISGLVKAANEYSYMIVDGDIPCTPEV